jgi:hypothetical protein
MKSSNEIFSLGIDQHQRRPLMHLRYKDYVSEDTLQETEAELKETYPDIDWIVSGPDIAIKRLA